MRSDRLALPASRLGGGLKVDLAAAFGALNFKLRIGRVAVFATVRNRNAFRHGFQFVEPNPALHLIRENCCLLERTDTPM
jgi:hypothetical protein